jgi:hypothetical protein
MPNRTLLLIVDQEAGVRSKLSVFIAELQARKRIIQILNSGVGVERMASDRKHDYGCDDVMIERVK